MTTIGSFVFIDMVCGIRWDHPLVLFWLCVGAYIAWLYYWLLPVTFVFVVLATYGIGHRHRRVQSEVDQRLSTIEEHINGLYEFGEPKDGNAKDIKRLDLFFRNIEGRMIQMEQQFGDKHDVALPVVARRVNSSQSHAIHDDDDDDDVMPPLERIPDGRRAIGVAKRGVEDVGLMTPK